MRRDTIKSKMRKMKQLIRLIRAQGKLLNKKKYLKSPMIIPDRISRL